MKFFSLKTKKHVVWWSVIIGFFVSLLVLVLEFKTFPNCYLKSYILPPGWSVLESIPNCYLFFTWPFDFTSYTLADLILKLVVYFIFWIFILVIILSLVRWGRMQSSKRSN